MDVLSASPLLTPRHVVRTVRRDPATVVLRHSRRRSGDGPVLFSRGDAARVLDFVNNAGPTEIIVIHCFAGVSRSPGVALALAEMNGWPVADLERRHPLWNT